MLTVFQEEAEAPRSGRAVPRSSPDSDADDSMWTKFGRWLSGS